MIKHSLETVTACPAAFRSHLKVEWFARNPGSPDWVEAGSGPDPLNNSSDYHEDLGVLSAIASRFGINFDDNDVSLMAYRWAQGTNTIFGAVIGSKMVTGTTFGLQWRVSVR